MIRCPTCIYFVKVILSLAALLVRTIAQLNITSLQAAATPMVLVLLFLTTTASSEFIFCSTQTLP